MANPPKATAHLIVCFLFGILFLNYPLLSLFSDPKTEIFGLPLLYGAIFLIWLLLIVLTALVVDTASEPSSGK